MAGADGRRVDGCGCRGVAKQFGPHAGIGLRNGVLRPRGERPTFQGREMSTSDEAPEKNEAEEYSAPEGSTCEMSWTSSGGAKLALKATSEWMVLRKKEKPAADIF